LPKARSRIGKSDKIFVDNAIQNAYEEARGVLTKISLEVLEEG
jgi:hypothetical protein